jgi:hypothetical protein
MRLVFQRFKEEVLKLRLKKCTFGLPEQDYYLGYIMFVGEISAS